MKSIFEKLYYGEISPCSQPTPVTERYLKAKDEVEQLGAEMLEKNPDFKDLLESYTEAIHITAACEGLQDFERGFRLSVMIMIEVMTTE